MDQLTPEAVPRRAISKQVKEHGETGAPQSIAVEISAYWLYEAAAGAGDDCVRLQNQ